MSTRVANQSAHVSCQPGTMATGRCGGAALGLGCCCCCCCCFGSVGPAAGFLGAGKDFGETGEGEDMGVSWSGSLSGDAMASEAVLVVVLDVEVMWETSWAERVWNSSMRRR